LFLSASLNLNAADATDKIKVFFNQPEATSPAKSAIANPKIGIDDALVEFMETAESGDNVYLCFFDSTTQKITNAFIDAKNIVGQGNIFHIMEREYGTGYGFLNNSIDDGTDGSPLMHNKFAVIIDTINKEGRLWTGSYNPTSNGTTKNNNNAVRIESYDLAKIYADEFLYMWNGRTGKFSTDKTASPYTNQEVTVGSTTIKVYFSPYEEVHPRGTSWVLENLFDDATNSILFNMFTFSVNETYLKGAVEGAFNNGLEVKGVVDAGQSSSIQNAFRSLGMDVVLDANDGKLHHKFCIIDYGTADPVVVTGSYNWTNQANEENDENFLVIHSREVADLYWEEFQKNYALAAGNISDFTEESVRDALVYPSPAKDVDEVTIGYELSPAVTDVRITVYTLYGEKVKDFDLELGEFYPGTYNEKIWNLQNDSSDDVAPGLYIIKVEGETGDGTVYDTSKFAVIR
jgi:hypothetical protein